MKSVHVKGVNYQITFRATMVARLAKIGFEQVEQICCAIYGGDCRFLASGVAMRSPLDTMDDLVGLKLALGRAVEQLSARHKLTKTDRAVFWDAFNSSIKAKQDQDAAIAKRIQDEQDRAEAGERASAERIYSVKLALAEVALQAERDRALTLEEAAQIEEQALAERKHQARIRELAKVIHAASERHEKHGTDVDACTICQKLKRELEQLKDDAA